MRGFVNRPPVSRSLFAKRMLEAGVLTVCMFSLTQSASAHPGHGKPIEPTASGVVRHFATEPFHVVSTLAVVAVALTLGCVVIRNRKAAQ